MIIAQEIRHFVKNLVSIYATFNGNCDSYTLDVDDLPDFEMHNIALLWMADEDLANEAIGCDNPEYERSMLPAMIKYMKDTSNKDNEMAFNKAWIDGTASYFKRMTQELIDEACADYLNENYTSRGLKAYRHWDNGETFWR